MTTSIAANAVTVKSVFENTKLEVLDYIELTEWDDIIVKTYDVSGIQGLIDLENTITILHETGNVDGLSQKLEDLMDMFE